MIKEGMWQTKPEDLILSHGVETLNNYNWFTSTNRCMLYVTRTSILSESGTLFRCYS